MNPTARSRALRLAAATLVAATVAAGCSILRAAPDTSRYFVLSSTTTADGASAPRGRDDVRFGLGPIKLPGYLDAQGIVRSGPSGRIDYVPGAFWAEPVRDGFARALLHRTAARVGTSQAFAHPWYATTRLDWKVPVDVLRFEATSDGRALLVVRWGVEPTAGGPAASTEQTFEEQAGRDPEQVVDALSRCIDRLADAIATGLTSRAAPPPPRP